MVYSTENKVFFSTRRAGAGFTSLNNGDIVNAKILSLKEDGSARIFFNGNIFEGNVAGSLKEGDVLKMRVLITGDKVLLIPEPENLAQEKPFSESIFSQLGIPKNELSSAILSFLMTGNQKIEEKSIVKIFNFLKKIKKAPKKAAFAASLLENKGLDLDKELFKKVYSLIFGEEFGEEFDDDLSKENSSDKESLITTDIQEDKQKNDNTENSDSEILTLINHINSGYLHWLVFPFEKTINNTPAKGSVSFLFDINLKTIKYLILHCKLGEESWIFSLKDKLLTFMEENAGKKISKKEAENLEALFSVCLKENGLDSVTAKYGNIFEDEVNSIDIKV